MPLNGFVFSHTITCRSSLSLLPPQVCRRVAIPSHAPSCPLSYVHLRIGGALLLLQLTTLTVPSKLVSNVSHISISMSRFCLWASFLTFLCLSVYLTLLGQSILKTFPRHLCSEQPISFCNDCWTVNNLPPYAATGKMPTGSTVIFNPSVSVLS